MKKITLTLVIVLVLALFSACTGDITIEDGTYRAEYSDFDKQGYKEFIEITFEDGKVVGVSFDAVSGVDGSLKSESQDVRDQMESAQGTYPEKYYLDLINQYLEDPSAETIDTVAGATNSSHSFVVLARALEKSIRAGYTDTVIVDR